LQDAGARDGVVGEPLVYGITVAPLPKSPPNIELISTGTPVEVAEPIPVAVAGPPFETALAIPVPVAGPP